MFLTFTVLVLSMLLKLVQFFFRTFIFRTVYDVMTVSGLRKYRVEGYVYVTSGECRVVSARRREGGRGELCTQGGAGWKTVWRPNNRRNASHHS